MTLMGLMELLQKSETQSVLYNSFFICTCICYRSRTTDSLSVVDDTIDVR